MAVDGETRVRHILLLRDAGYIKGVKADTLEGAGIISPELTMPCHDLLDTLRSATVWERTRKVAKEKGVELTFDTVKALATVPMRADQLTADAARQTAAVRRSVGENAEEGAIPLLFNKKGSVQNLR